MPVRVTAAFGCQPDIVKGAVTPPGVRKQFTSGQRIPQSQGGSYRRREPGMLPLIATPARGSEALLIPLSEPL